MLASPLSDRYESKRERMMPTRRHLLWSAALLPLSAEHALGQQRELPIPIFDPDFKKEAYDDPCVIRPRRGYSPHIGILVSELLWMRYGALIPTANLKPAELDFLLDERANSIGALLLHLAATEKLYQLNTFENVRLKDLEKHPDFQAWNVAMNLGAPARESIKGHDLTFYLKILEEGRRKTLAELRKRDDAWLMTVDKTWSWGPTNNLCKWFHVCEHESHHSGQIALIKGRLPGAKKTDVG